MCAAVQQEFNSRKNVKNNKDIGDIEQVCFILFLRYLYVKRYQSFYLQGLQIKSNFHVER